MIEIAHPTALGLEGKGFGGCVFELPVSASNAINFLLLEKNEKR